MKNQKKTVYMDHSATTSLSSIALEKMIPFFTNRYGNPSSSHSYGREAKKELEKSRNKMIELLSGSEGSSLIFTSGGTEADNLAVCGFLRQNQKKHLITSVIEHSALLETCKFLEKNGYTVTYLPVDRYGHISLQQLESEITSETALVSVMFANNEIGTIQRVHEIGEICHRKNVVFHTDAVQALGHTPISVKELGIDMLSFSGHKFHGPKGVGGLYLSSGITVTPIFYGGKQEYSLRAGTENLPNIIGMTVALEESINNLSYNGEHFSKLREKLEQGLLQIEGCSLSGDPVLRLPHLSSFVFESLSGEGLVNLLDMQGICASSASACSVGTEQLSHVYRALGYSDSCGTLRLSLGAYNTEDEVEYVIEKVQNITSKLRKMKKNI